MEKKELLLKDLWHSVNDVPTEFCNIMAQREDGSLVCGCYFPDDDQFSPDDDREDAYNWETIRMKRYFVIDDILNVD